MLENLPQTPVASRSTSSLPPIKEEITSLGIANKSNKSKKLKVALIVFALFLLFASVPTAVYLVRQNQEVRKEATGCDATHTEGQCDCNWGECKGVSWHCNGESWYNVYDSACNGSCTNCNVEPTQEPIPSRTPACGQACCGSIPAEKGGGTCGECRSWESCSVSNGGCPSGKSCCSNRGCANDSDCCSGKCQGGTCTGAGSLECHADETGVTIVNNTGSPVSGNVSFFTSWCGGTTCFCSGQKRNQTINLGISDANKTWHSGIVGNGPPGQCSWQSDVEFVGCSNADHGCVAGCAGVTPTPTPITTATPTPVATATPPIYTVACEYCRIYDSSWVRIIDFSNIRVGQAVYFATSGTTTQPQGITKARFRINGGVWQETTNTHEGKFYIQYTVPSATTYTVESMVYNPTLGWY